ncbi:MAG: hypothetical protein ABIH10_01995 [Spirochaetota bacterium]
MESIKIEKIKLKKPRVYTKEQELADTIFFYFKKEIKFPTIMSFIKRKGYQAIYEIWNDVKHSKPKNEVALFLWKVKNEKVIYKNGKQKSKNNHNRK